MNKRETDARRRVCAAARTWIGTPYHDLGEIKGRSGGVDCAKLIKLVFLEAGLIPPIEIPDYSPQWFLHRDAELYMNRVLDLAAEIPEERATFGDVVLYKIGRCFAHGALIIEPGWPHIIHAHAQSRCVTEAHGTDPGLGSRQKKFFSRFARR